MKLHVVVRRQTPDDPAPGFFEAHAYQGTLKGSDLLAGLRIKNKDLAIEWADKRILAQFRTSSSLIMDPPEIEYEVKE